MQGPEKAPPVSGISRSWKEGGPRETGGRAGTGSVYLRTKAGKENRRR